MSNALFRDPQAERLASPDQLDRALVVVRPRAWLGLAVLGLAAITLLTWSLTTRVERTLVGEGIWVQSAQACAIGYVADEGSAGAVPGTTARVRPVTSRGVADEWIDARIAAVGSSVASIASMTTRLRDPDLARDVRSRLGSPVEVAFTDPQPTPSGLGPQDLADGTRVRIEIIVWSGRPFDLLMGRRVAPTVARTR